MAAKKKTWSRKPKFSLTEKAAILGEAETLGIGATRRKYGLHKSTLSNWRARGIIPLQAVPQNGNGHHEEPPPPSTTGGLADIERALEAMRVATEGALAAVREHRAHARRVFLGGD